MIQREGLNEFRKKERKKIKGKERGREREVERFFKHLNSLHSFASFLLLPSLSFCNSFALSLSIK